MASPGGACHPTRACTARTWRSAVGGTGTVEEIEQRIANQLGLTAEQRSRPHRGKVGSRSELAYRLAWARTYLRKLGLICAVERKRWSAGPTDLATRSRTDLRPRGRPGTLSLSRRGGTTQSGLQSRPRTRCLMTRWRTVLLQRHVYRRRTDDNSATAANLRRPPWPACLSSLSVQGRGRGRWVPVPGSVSPLVRQWPWTRHLIILSQANPHRFRKRRTCSATSSSEMGSTCPERTSSRRRSASAAHKARVSASANGSRLSTRRSASRARASAPSERASSVSCSSGMGLPERYALPGQSKTGGVRTPALGTSHLRAGVNLSRPGACGGEKPVALSTAVDPPLTRSAPRDPRA